MRRCVSFLALAFLLGCGGEGASDPGGGPDGSVSLFFSEETDFSPSSLGFFSFDSIEGINDDDLVDVTLESGSRTLEVYLQDSNLVSGDRLDLESDLDSGVLLETAFGDAEAVAGTIRVEYRDSDEVRLVLDDVLMADKDGEGTAVLDGRLTFYPGDLEPTRVAHRRMARNGAQSGR